MSLSFRKVAATTYKVRITSAVYWDLRARDMDTNWDEPGANPYIKILAPGKPSTVELDAAELEVLIGECKWGIDDLYGANADFPGTRRAYGSLLEKLLALRNG